MRVEELSQELRGSWFSPDLQGKLEIDDEREGFAPESPKITRNENGQLFAVMYYLALGKLNLLTDQDRLNFILMVELSAKENGLYFRRYKDTGIRQSHDNIVGLSVGSLLFDTRHAELICQWGLQNGWCFHVQSDIRWDIRSCLQGGDIALVKLCAGFLPNVWELLWLYLGLCFTWKDAGQINLARVRIQGLEIIQNKFKLPEQFHKWIKIIIDTFNLRYSRKFDDSVQKYFGRETGPENPYIILNRMALKNEAHF